MRRFSMSRDQIESNRQKARKRMKRGMSEEVVNARRRLEASAKQARENKSVAGAPAARGPQMKTFRGSSRPGMPRDTARMAPMGSGRKESVSSLAKRLHEKAATNTQKGNPREGMKFLTLTDRKGRTVHDYGGGRRVVLTKPASPGSDGAGRPAPRTGQPGPPGPVDNSGQNLSTLAQQRRRRRMPLSRTTTR